MTSSAGDPDDAGAVARQAHLGRQRLGADPGRRERQRSSPTWRGSGSGRRGRRRRATAPAGSCRSMRPAPRPSSRPRSPARSGRRRGTVSPWNRGVPMAQVPPTTENDDASGPTALSTVRLTPPGPWFSSVDRLHRRDRAGRDRAEVEARDERRQGQHRHRGGACRCRSTPRCAASRPRCWSRAGCRRRRCARSWPGRCRCRSRPPGVSTGGQAAALTLLKPVPWTAIEATRGRRCRC